MKNKNNKQQYLKDSFTAEISHKKKHSENLFIAEIFNEQKSTKKK